VRDRCQGDCAHRSDARRPTPDALDEACTPGATLAAVLALLLVVALTVATLTLAHRLELLTDVLLVIGASVLGGLVFLAARPDLPWVAAAPDDADATCGADHVPFVAPLVERVSVDEAQALLGQPQITFVDARPAADYVAAHVPGAMNLPATDAAGLLDMQSLPIPPEGEVITYCEGGRCEQSEYLGTLLRERDVCQRVRVLEGGWLAWVAADAPTVAGASRFGDAPMSSSSEVSPEVSP
jgi:rhodanese-related sulfurtransferase